MAPDAGKLVDGYVGEEIRYLFGQHDRQAIGSLAFHR